MSNKAGLLELETEVLIIGGGVTGTGVMRDLALRGISCLLIDRKDLNAGASGGNHGLLHSGGRYATSDCETAAECRIEGEILKSIAADAVDPCGGIFAAVEGDDPDFAEKFPQHCERAGISCTELTNTEARQLEPALSDRVFAAFQVPDASIDPFRLTLANVQHAKQINDSDYLPHTQVISFEITDGEITSAICQDHRSGSILKIRARQFVNATGAWAKMVAELADCHDVNLLYSKGSLIISNTRITQGVVNRLRPPGDGDIVVPGGTVSLLGTTSDSIDNLDKIRPSVAEVDRILKQGTALIPGLETTRFIRAFAGVRPLLMSSGAAQDGRRASRGFTLYDHQQQGLSNFATIAGGKLTTYRLMAEKTGDLVAKRLNNSNPCRTAELTLPTDEGVRWTEPGYSARHWFKHSNASDLILCECEMVPQSAVDKVIKLAPGAEDEMTVQAIGLRSRIGKGTCQGAFCSMRVTSHLYDQHIYNNRDGLRHMRDFVGGRFKGIKPILWGEQMPQFELAETMHCGLMGLDFFEPELPKSDDQVKSENSESSS
ncbi:MAG: anaerobic glycerol-3-phosphate dehydrogenase subunit A [Gammaproteobacteria bacterium]|nr:anaerobic glycerol-3-phosphate dehydrogenase subunit A [Gammaproteobacteria bacterium]